MGPYPNPEVVAWLVASDEPAARWTTLTALLGRPAGDPEVEAAHRSVLVDPGTRDLIGRLGDWDRPGPLSGHDSAAYAPNLLSLLAAMGVRGGDDPVVDAMVDSMLRHRDGEGRFASPTINSRIGPDLVLSALPCDNHIIVETLVRYGRCSDPAVRQALDRMAADMTATAQGNGWPCRASNNFRGPGRKGDVCPQATLEALRTIARLPEELRPAGPADIAAAARTTLRVWTGRGAEKPYIFGHGLGFKTVKWPPFWYGAMWTLDAIGRFPDLWRDGADPQDRRAVAELAACLLAYNTDPDGRVTPRSCYRGFEAFSFGQKKRPSPFATASVYAVLKPFEDLADEIAAVDVAALGSSKGGTGSPVAPRSGPRAKG
jgi:hypothetical protein